VSQLLEINIFHLSLLQSNARPHRPTFHFCVKISAHTTPLFTSLYISFPSSFHHQFSDPRRVGSSAVGRSELATTHTGLNGHWQRGIPFLAFMLGVLLGSPLHNGDWGIRCGVGFLGAFSSIRRGDSLFAVLLFKIAFGVRQCSGVAAFTFWVLLPNLNFCLATLVRWTVSMPSLWKQFCSAFFSRICLVVVTTWLASKCYTLTRLVLTTTIENEALKMVEVSHDYHLHLGSQVQLLRHSDTRY
jgi:hypothetical protein